MAGDLGVSKYTGHKITKKIVLSSRKPSSAKSSRRKSGGSGSSSGSGSARPSTSSSRPKVSTAKDYESQGYGTAQSAQLAKYEAKGDAAAVSRLKATFEKREKQKVSTEEARVSRPSKSSRRPGTGAEMLSVSFAEELEGAPRVRVSRPETAGYLGLLAKQDVVSVVSPKVTITRKSVRGGAPSPILITPTPTAIGAERPLTGREMLSVKTEEVAVREERPRDYLSLLSEERVGGLGPERLEEEKEVKDRLFKPSPLQFGLMAGEAAKQKYVDPITEKIWKAGGASIDLKSPGEAKSEFFPAWKYTPEEQKAKLIEYYGEKQRELGGFAIPFTEQQKEASRLKGYLEEVTGMGTIETGTPPLLGPSGWYGGLGKIGAFLTKTDVAVAGVGVGKLTAASTKSAKALGLAKQFVVNLPYWALKGQVGAELYQAEAQAGKSAEFKATDTTKSIYDAASEMESRAVSEKGFVPGIYYGITPMLSTEKETFYESAEIAMDALGLTEKQKVAERKKLYAYKEDIEMADLIKSIVTEQGGELVGRTGKQFLGPVTGPKGFFGFTAATGGAVEGGSEGIDRFISMKGKPLIGDYYTGGPEFLVLPKVEQEKIISEYKDLSTKQTDKIRSIGLKNIDYDIQSQEYQAASDEYKFMVDEYNQVIRGGGVPSAELSAGISLSSQNLFKELSDVKALEGPITTEIAEIKDIQSKMSALPEVGLVEPAWYQQRALQPAIGAGMGFGVAGLGETLAYGRPGVKYGKFGKGVQQTARAGFYGIEPVEPIGDILTDIGYGALTPSQVVTFSGGFASTPIATQDFAAAEIPSLGKAPTVGYDLSLSNIPGGPSLELGFEPGASIAQGLSLSETPAIMETPTTTRRGSSSRTVTVSPAIAETPTVSEIPAFAETPTFIETPTVSLSETPSFMETPAFVETPVITETLTSSFTETPSYTFTPPVGAGGLPFGMFGQGLGGYFGPGNGEFDIMENRLADISGEFFGRKAQSLVDAPLAGAPVLFGALTYKQPIMRQGVTPEMMRMQAIRKASPVQKRPSFNQRFGEKMKVTTKNKVFANPLNNSPKKKNMKKFFKKKF